MVPFFTGAVRFALIVVFVFVGFGAVFARLVQLQVFRHEYFASRAAEVRSRFDELKAARGDIVDAQGNLLATNRTMVEVGVDPGVIVREDFGQTGAIARLLGLPEREVVEAFNRRTRTTSDGRVAEVRWVKLAEGVDQETYERVLEVGVRGVYGIHRFERVYPAGRLAAHVIGFLNDEGVPSGGVETSFDFYLSGQDGWRESENDGRRREVALFREREVDPMPGLNVELTLDLTLQAIAEREIKAVVAEFNPEAVTVLISDPRTGDILALANHPGFDPNSFNEFPVSSHRNRALTDVYEPGSTFKIVPAAGALQESLVRPDTAIDCGASVAEYRGRRVSLPSDHHPYEELTVREVVVKSSNRGAARLGILLGEERLHHYSSLFGFGSRTGILLGPESAGILHPPSAWDGLTISRLPMGHAVSATPLQVHQAMSVIAAGGMRYPPRVVRRIFDDEGATVVPFPPHDGERVLDAAVAGELARFLEEVVREGTATKAAIDHYRVAGKTGTTQMIVDGRYSREDHIASFSGFLPANDPRVVITVVVRRPQREGGVGYGGQVAAPAFRRIALEAVHHLAIPPDRAQRPEIYAANTNHAPSSRPPNQHPD